MDRNSFAMTIRECNKNLHTAAETTGFNARLVAGNATKESYAEFLFNLKAAYEAIERNLDKNMNFEGLKPFVTKELYRSSKMDQDLKALLKDKYKTMELLPSTKAYVARIDEIGEKNPMLVVAHAYARFLADLFGGRTIYQIVKDNYKIEEDALNYYDFPEIKDIRAYVMGYIEKLGNMNLSKDMEALMLNEIANTYMYNIGVSVELETKLFPVDNATYNQKPAGHPHTGHGHGKGMPEGHPEIKPGMVIPNGHPEIPRHPHVKPGMVIPERFGHGHGHPKMPAGHLEVKQGMKIPHTNTHFDGHHHADHPPVGHHHAEHPHK